MIMVIFAWVLKFRDKFIGFKGENMMEFRGIWGNFVMNLGVMVLGFTWPETKCFESGHPTMLWDMPSRSRINTTDGFTCLFFFVWLLRKCNRSLKLDMWIVLLSFFIIFVK
ncbi:hypothetical protein Ddye_005557 [Dipteronia dyeriana]|uniref:Uncharacterized protein n=1 Tax=Dipteronia dyeriana TaxID=168575 RepID=A0AAD9XGJ5_9ROSI|nr:hypothetical protein Ddye_005557 [Dipteronia dyeriana]